MLHLYRPILGLSKKGGNSPLTLLGCSQLPFVSLEGAVWATQVKVDGGLGYIR